jgi:GNAT superfamily N-acetyltransferase
MAKKFAQCQLLFKERGLTLTRCEDAYGMTFRVVDSTGKQQGVAEVGVHKRTRQGRSKNTLKVGYIHVDPSQRKTRVGTLLYDALLGEACERGMPLTSDTLRSHFAEAFWQKQRKKGRATCVRGGGGVFTVPLLELEYRHDTGEISTKAYNETIARLPKPTKKTDEYGRPMWSCRRYEINKTCDVETLAGLKRRKPSKPRKRR